MKLLLAMTVLAFSSMSLAAKTYQVTGPVVDVTDNMIVVMKGKDRWELDKSTATKTMGDVKVGDKVTIEYTMAADKIEVKDSKKKK